MYAHQTETTETSYNSLQFSFRNGDCFEKKDFVPRGNLCADQESFDTGVQL